MNKSIVVIFLSAVLLFVLLFALYSSKILRRNELSLLTEQERQNAAKYGSFNEKFRFCSYPEGDSSKQVDWVEENGPYEAKCLRLLFREDSFKHYLGIHLNLTLHFNSYTEKGAIEFLVKNSKNRQLPVDFGLRLRDGPVMNKTMEFSLPVVINGDWQRISFPLSAFRRTDVVGSRDDGFTWLIQEILFSIPPFTGDAARELLIKDLRLVNGNEIIYELF